jgi:hypothetical protein
MKTKLYLLFFFVFPLFMSACRGDDPIPDPPVDGKRTVLVYMAADNSINPLASFTDGDLEETDISYLSQIRFEQFTTITLS